MGDNSEHARFSPSASSRWLTCTASVKAVEESGILSTTSEYAHEGTVCHEVSAKCLKEQLNPVSFRGKEIDGVIITDELTEAIQLYVDEIRGVIKEFDFTNGAIEHEIKINDECWGTLDAGLWNKDLMFVGDAKFGSGVLVPAVDNTQLLIYAVGLMMKLQVEHGLAPSRVILCIIQPRTPNPVRRWEVTRKDVIAFYKETLMPALVEAKSEARKFVPSESACRWCPLSGRCAAQNSMAVDIVEKAFSAFKPEEPTPSLPPVPEGPVLDNNELALIYSHRKLIDSMFNDMHAYLHDELMAGREVQGFKMVEGRSVRTWDGEESDIVSKLAEMAPDVDPYIKKLKTAPAVEKEIGKVTAKKLGLPDLIYKPKGTPTMVPDTDPRKSITEEVEVGAVMEEFAVEDKTATSGNLEMELASGSTVEFAGEGEPIVGSNDPAPSSDQGGVLNSLLSSVSVDDDDDDDDDIPVVVEEKPLKSTVKLPAKNTKRWQLIALKKGSLASAAEALSSTENSIRTMLAWTHDRDGCGYRLMSDNTFEIFTE
jgi:hypothetical protein